MPPELQRFSNFTNLKFVYYAEPFHPFEDRTRNAPRPCPRLSTMPALLVIANYFKCRFSLVCFVFGVSLASFIFPAEETRSIYCWTPFCLFNYGVEDHTHARRPTHGEFQIARWQFFTFVDKTLSRMSIDAFFPGLIARNGGYLNFVSGFWRHCRRTMRATTREIFAF